MLALHLLIFIALLLTTQIGGLLYLVAFIIGMMAKNLFNVHRLVSLAIMLVVLGGGWYAAYLLLPKVSYPSAGTAPTACTPHNGVRAAHQIYCITFRNYADNRVNRVLEDLASKMPQDENKPVEIVVMDSGFPFPHWAFPMLPHSEHRQAVQVDIALWYEGQVQPSPIGYYAFSQPGGENPSANCPDELGTGPLGKQGVPAIDAERTSQALQILSTLPYVERVEVAQHVLDLAGEVKEGSVLTFPGCDAGPLSDRIRITVTPSQ
ncbi:MAG: hypothetical protein Alpg2KO_29910 [Alphaproteobacteria bacterium]